MLDLRSQTGGAYASFNSGCVRGSLANCHFPAQNKTDVPKPRRFSPRPRRPRSSARLPVKRVVLYKNGVGYFEHAARVHGTQDLSIDFTTAQLNDVLKSLTAVDLGEGRVSSVRYNSIAPLDERLQSLRLPFGEQVTQAEYLMALRGARVEVRSGSATAAGRLLSVEKIRKQRTRDDFEDVTAFSIVTDAGEMKNFELGSGTSVRIAERELTDEVARYLSLIGSSRARDVRRMTFTAAGVRRPRYLRQLHQRGADLEEHVPDHLPREVGREAAATGLGHRRQHHRRRLERCSASLVAGAPQSFIQDISQPFYARRPVCRCRESVMLTPQSHEATMSDRLEQSQITDWRGGPSHATTSLAAS